MNIKNKNMIYEAVSIGGYACVWEGARLQPKYLCRTSHAELLLYFTNSNMYHIACAGLCVCVCVCVYR